MYLLYPVAQPGFFKEGSEDEKKSNKNHTYYFQSYQTLRHFTILDRRVLKILNYGGKMGERYYEEMWECGVYSGRGDDG